MDWSAVCDYGISWQFILYEPSNLTVSNTQYNLSILKPMGIRSSKLYLIVFQRFVSTSIMIEQLTCASLP